MKCFSVALVVIAACGGEDGLDADELATAEDALDSVQAGGTIVDGVEVVLSGDVDPSLAPAAAAAASVADAQPRLTPSSCLVSTVADNVVTHVLTGCTGRRGRLYSGTVVSTWTTEGACLRVSHASDDFTIGNRQVAGTLEVVICRAGATETRDRTLQLETTTRAGLPLTMAGSWQLEIDAEGCATQAGTVTVSTPARTFDRDDSEMTWCAVSAKPLEQGETFDVLKSATLSISLDVEPNDTSLDLRFLGFTVDTAAEFEVIDRDGNRVLVAVGDVL